MLSVVHAEWWYMLSGGEANSLEDGKLKSYMQLVQGHLKLFL